MQSENIVMGFNLGLASVKVGAYGDNEATAVDLGRTDGGIELSIDRDTKLIETDQDIAPVAAKETKRVMKLKFKLIEATLANLALAFNLPVAAVADGVLDLGAVATGGEIYRSLFLNLDGTMGGIRKLDIPKVTITGNGSHAYSKDKPVSIEIEATVLWDRTKETKQLGSFADTEADVTAPTVALSSPIDGATVAKNAKGTVTWTFTEAGQIDESSLVYGRSVMIMNTTTPASAALVAGAIVYDPATKTIIFTPTENWTGLDTFQVIVTPEVKDVSGNHLAAVKCEQFSVSNA